MSRVEEEDILDLLSSLIDKSLVVYEENAQGQGRYRLLETMRRYGNDRLAESGEAERMWQRHQEVFSALAGEAEPELSGPEETRWLTRLEAEHDNLRSALGWCTRDDGKGEGGKGAEDGLSLASALFRFWRRRGHHSEGRQWLGRLLELAGDAAAPELQAKGRNAAGFLALDQGEYEASRSFFEQARTLAQQAGDKRSRAAALSGLGLLAAFQDDPSSVQSRNEECLALCREGGDRQGIAEALSGLGTAAHLRGEYKAAQAFFEESLMLWRQVGNRGGIASCLHSLARAALFDNDWTRAQALYEDALSIFRQTEVRTGMCQTIAALGYIAYYQDDYAKAWEYYQESLTLSRQMGIQYVTTGSLGFLGRVAAHRHDDGTARMLLTEAITLARQLVHQRAVVGALDGFTLLAHGQTQFERAARLLGAADSLSSPVFARPPLAVQRAQERQRTAVQSEMSAAAFVAAFAEGEAMTLESAAEYALTDE